MREAQRPKAPTGFVSLEAAAKVLDLSERQIRRDINEGRLQAKRQSGQVWVDQVSLSRFRLKQLAENWETQFRMADADQTDAVMFGELPVVFVWRAPGAPEDFEDRLPSASLTVPMLDFPRLTRPTSAEAARKELQALIPGHPESFQVRFSLDPTEVWKTLTRIVKGCRRPPELSGRPVDELRLDAALHLLGLLPHLLDGTDSDPEAYIKTAVRRFYYDKIAEVKLARKKEEEYAREPSLKPRRGSLSDPDPIKAEAASAQTDVTERVHETWAGDLDIAADLAADPDDFTEPDDYSTYLKE